MAEIFKRASNGMKTTKVIAYTQESQDGLDYHQDVIATRARAILRAHRAEGHAKIVTKRAKLDRHIILDDTAGLSAAMSIEYGTERSAAVAPLRIAAGIPVGDAELRRARRERRNERQRRRRRLIDG